jgi:hypothetical protein
VRGVTRDNLLGVAAMVIGMAAINGAQVVFPQLAALPGWVFFIGVAAAAALVYGSIRGIPAALGKVKLGRGDVIGLVGIALGVLTWLFPRH